MIVIFHRAETERLWVGLVRLLGCEILPKYFC